MSWPFLEAKTASWLRGWEQPSQKRFCLIETARTVARPRALSLRSLAKNGKGGVFLGKNIFFEKKN